MGRLQRLKEVTTEAIEVVSKTHAVDLSLFLREVRDTLEQRQFEGRKLQNSPAQPVEPSEEKETKCWMGVPATLASVGVIAIVGAGPAAPPAAASDRLKA